MRITEPYTIFLRTLKSGRKVYYYQFRDENGRRSACYSLATSSSGEAKRRAARLYREGKMAKNIDITFASFAQGFFDDGSKYLCSHENAGRKLSESTLRTYRSVLEYHILPFFCKMKLSAITDDNVEQWVVSLKVSAHTASIAQTVFTVIMKSAVRKRIIDRVPTALRRRVEKKSRTLLTVNELNQIYHAFGEGKDVFLLLCVTGLRIGEALGLSEDDIFPNYLHIRHSLGRYGLGETKTRKARFVPCPLEVHLPFKKGKKRLNENIMLRQLRITCDSLNIAYTERGLSLHSLRSFFNTYLRSKGISDAKIRGVMGHKDGTMTDWYTNWDVSMFDDVLEVQKQLIELIVS